ncbi:hypothetical protein K8R66_04230 [bacterium]|nr:hypothetical protein [bacterium]
MCKSKYEVFNSYDFNEDGSFGSTDHNNMKSVKKRINEVKNNPKLVNSIIVDNYGKKVVVIKGDVNYFKSYLDKVLPDWEIRS